MCGMPLPARRFRLHFLVWLALCAMLMNALAPSISRALAVAQGNSSAEICRAGYGRVLQDGGVDTMAAMADCAYCLPHAGSFALPPPALAAAGLFGSHGVRPFLFYRAPQPLLALTAAPPRGPPLAA